MLIYLGGPIDGQADAQDWKIDLKLRLLGVSCSTYDPAGAFTWARDGASARAIIAVNEIALDRCDVLFAKFRRGSVGVCREIERATIQGKGVILWGVSRREQNRHVYLQDERLVVRETLNQALSCLFNLLRKQKGACPLDPS